MVGWFQGRAEWGPRALGNRSILGDPRRADMKDLSNLKIKRRESFRPFAPSILEERTGEWFMQSLSRPVHAQGLPDPAGEARLRCRRSPTSTAPGGCRPSPSARTRATAELIRAFEAETGVPMVLNTSFNENEPIVNTPAEALDCFLRTKMDRLVMGRGRAIAKCALLPRLLNDSDSNFLLWRMSSYWRSTPSR